MTSLNRYACLGLALGIFAITSSAAQQPKTVGVKNEACRVALIKECVAEQLTKLGSTCGPVNKEAPSKFEMRCGTVLGATSNYINECKAIVDEWHFDKCIEEVDIATIANGEAIRAEIAETNRVLREDQRALLNQLCRAVGGQQAACDDALSPKK